MEYRDLETGDIIWDAKELQKFLRISKNTLYKILKTDLTIPYRKIGRQHFFYKSQIEKWLQEKSKNFCK